MNQNLDEAIYSSASAFFLVLAFSLFFIMYSIQLNINDISYRFTQTNDADVAEIYGIDGAQENLVSGAQVVRALMSLSEENYNVVVHGQTFEPSMTFEEMNLNSITIDDDYKIRTDRKEDGAIEQVVYQQIP